MKDLVIVDGDHITFRCAASAEQEEQWVAEARCDELLRRIIFETDAQDFVIYLGGEDNFRKKLYPEYKANRRGKPLPIWLESCREHLIKHWNASIVHGQEADDACGIDLTKHGHGAVCASLDKDLMQVPGYHYNFVKSLITLVSPLDGLRNLYKQLILGDKTDNVPGFDGKLRSEVPKFIQKYFDVIDNLSEEKDMYEFVLSLYEDKAVVPLYAQLLYIRRKEDDEWRAPV